MNWKGLQQSSDWMYLTDCVLLRDHQQITFVTDF